MKKSQDYKKYVLVITMSVQIVLVSLVFAYANYGTYEHNQASNIWAVLWDYGLGLFLFVSSVISLVAGIVGLCTKKENASHRVLPVILIILFVMGVFCEILAIGAHF